MSAQPHFEEEDGPAGGWGSVKAVAGALWQQRVPITGAALLLKQNKPGGFACVSCAWAKPAHPHPAEFCENGAKATAWELTGKRLGDDFFEQHTLAELRGWSDHALEDAGRLLRPMRWDAASDTYRPVAWEQAYAEIGVELQALAPERVVFYASGRVSLEASCLCQLLARVYGNNNLPDSSNMYHESTSVALPKTIGVPVGTVTLDDFEHTDAIFFFGQNVGTNSPRMLHQLQEARQRGVPIVTFNPLRERGLLSFKNPQSPIEMLGGDETCISIQYHQVKVGGDTAALMGMAKALLEMDDAAIAAGHPAVPDHLFIGQHCNGFDDFAHAARVAKWRNIERESRLAQQELCAAAGVYAQARAVIARLKRQLAADGARPIYANDNYGDWQTNFGSLWTHCSRVAGETGQMASALKPQKSGFTILKPRHSTSYATPLHLLLTQLRCRRLVVTGLAADRCVLFTAMDANHHGYALWVPADCTAAQTLRAKHQALEQMQRTLAWAGPSPLKPGYRTNSQGALHE